jgi:hypothetical protein
MAMAKLQMLMPRMNYSTLCCAKAGVVHWSPVTLDFVVADLDAAVQRVLGAGATPESPARDFA